MGLWNFLVGDYKEGYSNGGDWAETLHEEDADVVPEQVHRMAEDLGQHPEAFYEGFRDEWNSYPDVEEAEPRKRFLGIF